MHLQGRGPNAACPWPGGQKAHFQGAVHGENRARKTLIESTQPQSATKPALGGPLHSKTQGCASFTSENNTAKTSAKTPRVRKLRQELSPNAFAARNVRQGKTVQDGKTRNRKTLGRKRRWRRKIGSGVIVASACAHAGERRTPPELTYAPSMPRVASGFTSVLIRQGLRPAARYSAGGKAAREALPRVHTERQASERPNSSHVA